MKHIFTADDESVTKMILTRKIKSVDELYLVLLHNHWDYFISGVQCLQLLHHLQQYLNNDSNDNNNENTKKSSTVKDVYSLHFEKLLFSITNYMAMVFENILTSELMQYATAFLEYAEAVVQILYSTADKLLFVLDLIISSISFVDNKALGSLKRLVCSLLAVLERISDYIYPKFHANVGINSLRATAEKSIELIVMITKLLFIVNTAVQKVDIIIGKADKNNNLPFCLRSICTVINSTLQTYPIVAKQVSLSSYYHNNYRVNLVLILAEMIESISILFTSNLPIYRSDVLATHRSDNERAKLLESSSNSVYMHGDEHFNIVEKLSGLKVDRAVSPPWQSPAASISSSPNPVTRRGYGTPQAVLASPTGGSSQQSSPKGATSDQKLSERWNIPVDSQQSKIRKYSGKGALVYVQQNYYYIIILLDLLASLWYVQSTNSGNTRCRLSVRSEGYGISGVKSNERGNHIQHKNSVGSARLLNSIESLLKRIFHSVFRGRENDVDIRLVRNSTVIVVVSECLPLIVFLILLLVGDV